MSGDRAFPREQSESALSHRPTAGPQAGAAPVVLQDWAPLSACLDFHLGHLAFQHRGMLAFASNEVPYLINQGGWAATRAAEILYASCAVAEAAGALEAEIVALEIAAGAGLHAAQLLDRFAERCRHEGRDWYERLTLWVTDGSPQLLSDIRDRGVLRRHAGHAVLAHLDAREPTRARRMDDDQVVDLKGVVRLMMHSYLLCVLPANMFRASRPGADGARRWEVLLARTVLRDPGVLAQVTTLTVEEVQRRVAQGGAADIAPLVELFPLWDLDLRLAAVAASQLPDPHLLESIAALIEAAQPDKDPAVPTWVLDNFVARAAIEASWAALRDDGLLLYRDYGPATAAESDRPHIYQHYGASTAIGVHHFAMDAWITGRLGGTVLAEVAAPTGDAQATIHTRLAGRAIAPPVREALERGHGEAAMRDLNVAIEGARAAATGAEAMAAYRRALAMEPANWALLAEAGDVAWRKAELDELAEVLLTSALAINPWTSVVAWNSLAELYMKHHKFDDAERCFASSISVNPQHPSGYFGHYLVARSRRDYARALEMAGRALAADRDRSDPVRYRAAIDDAARLLDAQRELLAGLRTRRTAGAAH